MSFNKQNLIQGLKERFRQKRKHKDRQIYLFPEFDYEPLPSTRAGKMVDSFFEIIKARLERGDHVLIRGFGKFEVRFRWARKGHNPRTGHPIFIPSRRTVIFKCSNKLKQKLNR